LLLILRVSTYHFLRAFVPPSTQPYLILAVEEGEMGCVQELIKHGVDLNAVDRRSQFTALITAIIENQPEMVEAILAAKVQTFPVPSLFSPGPTSLLHI
jgi:ankyrin repeat protein